MVTAQQPSTPPGILDITNAMDKLRSRRQTQAVIPAVMEDDLRWLLDKEEHGSLQEAAAEQDKAALAALEEAVSQSRIQLGNLRSITLQRAERVRAAEEELRVLQQAAIDTRHERKEAAAQNARHNATKERVEEMERLADEQSEYSLTLDLVLKRLFAAKGGGDEVLTSLREQISELELRRNRQEAANGEVVHSAWQARNGATLQLQLGMKQNRAQALLTGKRKQLIAKAKRDAAASEAELLEQQKLRRRSTIAEEAEEDVRLGVRHMQTQQVFGRLRLLEEQFHRVQELMGFAEIHAVVERIQAQQQAGQRMTQLKADAIAKHDYLLDLKAKMDCRYEEQLGGVDSELSKRRIQYNELVQQDEALSAKIDKRKGRADEVSLLVFKARVGIAQIEQRLTLFRKGGAAALAGGAADEADGAACVSVVGADLRDRGISEDGAGQSASTHGGGPGLAGADEGRDRFDADAAMLSGLAKVENELCDLGAETERVVGALEARQEAALAAGSEASVDELLASEWASNAPPPSGAKEGVLGILENMRTVSGSSTGVGTGGGGGGAGGGGSAVITREPSGAREAGAVAVTAGTIAISTSLAQAAKLVPISQNNVRVRSDSLSSMPIGLDAAIEGTNADVNRWRDERSVLRSSALGLPPPRETYEQLSPAYSGKTPRSLSVSARPGALRSSMRDSTPSGSVSMRDSFTMRRDTSGTFTMRDSTTSLRESQKGSFSGREGESMLQSTTSSAGGSLTDRPHRDRASSALQSTERPLTALPRRSTIGNAGPQPPSMPRPRSSTPRARPSSARPQ